MLIPKSVIVAAGLGEEVELRIVDSGLLIASAPHPRAGWEEASARMREAGDDELLDPTAETEFDATEWNWGSPAAVTATHSSPRLS